MPKNRFYYESDGGIGLKTHYVIDKYADPMGEMGRRDVSSRREGLALARMLNQYPDSEPWDTIQAARDGYTQKPDREDSRSGL